MKETIFIILSFNRRRRKGEEVKKQTRLNQARRKNEAFNHLTTYVDLHPIGNFVIGEMSIVDREH
jgi:hypothetical protein